MSACERVEFRVRLNGPEIAAAESASNMQQMVSTAMTGVQDAVTKALTKELAEV
jgi:ribosome-associated translation inhibitor RaiA